MVTAVIVTFGATVAVPVMTTGAEPVTEVTVPEPPPLDVETERSIVIVMPRPEVSVMGGLDDASVTVVIRVSSAVRRKGRRIGAHRWCRRSIAYPTNMCQVSGL